jgi:hypothetical protein
LRWRMEIWSFGDRFGDQKFFWKKFNNCLKLAGFASVIMGLNKEQ